MLHFKTKCASAWADTMTKNQTKKEFINQPIKQPILYNAAFFHRNEKTFFLNRNRDRNRSTWSWPIGSHVGLAIRGQSNRKWDWLLYYTLEQRINARRICRSTTQMTHLNGVPSEASSIESRLGWFRWKNNTLVVQQRKKKMREPWLKHKKHCWVWIFARLTDSSVTDRLPRTRDSKVVNALSSLWKKELRPGWMIPGINHDKKDWLLESISDCYIPSS